MTPIPANDDLPFCFREDAFRQAEFIRQRIKDDEMPRAPIHIQTFPPRKITGQQLAWNVAKLFGGCFLAGLLVYGALALREIHRVSVGL